MSNLVYLNNDPIILELESSVNKDAVKKTLAFKYFNGDESLLIEYLRTNLYEDVKPSFKNHYIEPKSQLEFSF
tara:strand:- start:10 stop:228 length:219 start_codon:yes stop_codon:yes gene_type:complete